MSGFPIKGFRRSYRYPSSRTSSSSGTALVRASGGAVAASVFAAYIPTFLVMFWSFAVLLWTLVVGFSSALSAPRSLRSELAALAVFAALGAALMLWSMLGLLIPAGLAARRAPEVYIQLFHVLKLLWGWFLSLALVGAWVWERRWARRHAHGQLQQSMQTIVSQDAALDMAAYAGHKDWASDGCDGSDGRPSGDAYRVPYDATYGDAGEGEITPFRHETAHAAGAAAYKTPPYEQTECPEYTSYSGPGQHQQESTAPDAASPSVSTKPSTKGGYMRVHNP